MKKPEAVIYLITNLVNGKRYVGATRFAIEKRWAEHRYKATLKAKSYLHRAIAKYGADNFKVEQIASCIGDWSECEKQVIQSLKPEYNLTNGGEITVGRRVSAEVKERIRQANIGKKRTPEQNARNSALKREQSKDPEYRKKLLAAGEKGRANKSEENRLAGIRRAAAEGKMSRVISPEHHAKMIAASKAPDVVARIAAAKMKPVECVTLNTVFDSVGAAADACGLSISGVSMVCLGKRKKVHGLVFTFVN